MAGDLPPASPLPEPRWTYRRPPVAGERCELVALYTRMRSWFAAPAGTIQSLRISGLLGRSPGLIALAEPYRIATLESWTLSIWDGVPSLSRFVQDPVHQRTMKRMRFWLRCGSVARIPLETSTPPPRREDIERWLAGGRPLPL